MEEKALPEKQQQDHLRLAFVEGRQQRHRRERAELAGEIAKHVLELEGKAAEFGEMAREYRRAARHWKRDAEEMLRQNRKEKFSHG